MDTSTIKAGDTFYHLARTYGITVGAIEAANPGVNPNDLQIGQVINIPVTPPAPVYLFDDEFDGAAGTPPDPAGWVYDLGYGDWGNNELETYRDPLGVQSSRVT
jgi:LysM repeat protein